jgi:pyruvate ferredoxin oxidoreductase alpha subunit
MAKRLALTGNDAAAEAMRQIDPDVVAAYPITPQTELMHKFAEFVADGVVNTELVLVESEHSALSATVGASAAGARAMTATSSQGLALMFEILHIASGLRLPIVMPMVNRALSAPINIHCDHSDSMSCRDTGWLQLYAENAQEVYDNVLMAIRVAEHPDVLLPIMVCYDGFIISHTAEAVEVLDDEVVRSFVGEYHPQQALLDIEHPITVGPLYLQDHYFEAKVQQARAHLHANRVIKDVAEKFGWSTDRWYGEIESYRMDDADRAIVVLGSTAGTAKEVVDRLRAQGDAVGMVKIRVFRPFPEPAIVSALRHVRAVAVLDRAIAFGTAGGPVYSEVRAALLGQAPGIKVVNYVYGLGGRDIFVEDIERVYGDLAILLDSDEPGFQTTYLGVREENELRPVYLNANGSMDQWVNG